MRINSKYIYIYIICIISLTFIISQNVTKFKTSIKINKQEVYESSFVNILTDGTYTSKSGTTIVVSSDIAKLNGTTSLTVASSNTGYKITGSGGPYYQLSSIAIVTSPSNSGQVAKTAYVLDSFTPIVDESGAYEVWTNNEKKATYSDLQSAVYAAETNSTIKLNKDVDATGGAYITGKKLTIDGNSHTINASTWLNGLFFVETDAELIINNLTIDGGATGFEVDYDSITYTNYTIPLVTNSAANDPKTYQPAIVSQGDITLNNVTAKNIYSNANGAVLSAEEGNVKISNSNFIHNRAEKYGGALQIGSNIATTSTAYPIKSIEITNSIFDQNYALHGGAIQTLNIGGLTIDKSTFTNNIANTGKGGAINLDDQNRSAPVNDTAGLALPTATINNSTFNSNWAGNDGFAIQTYGTHLYVNNCTLKNNVGVHPTSSVGTISVESYHTNEYIVFVANNCTFDSNIGPASVYSDHASPATTQFINCKFINNQGNMTILLYSSQTTIDNCNFTGDSVSKTIIDARIYAEQNITPPTITINDTSFNDTNGPTDVLISKHSSHTDEMRYVVTYTGTTVADTLVLDDSVVEVSGTLVGDIIIDQEAEGENIIINDNAKLVGEVIDSSNTTPVLFYWAYDDNVPTGTILYLEKDKTYTESEINLLLNAQKSGYKLELYTNSSYTTTWDYVPSQMLTIYGKWVEHTHNYGTDLFAYNGGFYYQCECGSLSEPIIALSIDEKYFYDGRIKEATLINPNNYSSDKYEIKYYKEQRDGTYALLKKAPKEVGKYKVTLVYEDEESSTFFKIAEGIPNPPTSSTNIVGIVALIAFLLLSVFGINRLALKLKNN